jgi:hypothetical protein
MRTWTNGSIAVALATFARDLNFLDAEPRPELALDLFIVKPPLPLHEVVVVVAGKKSLLLRVRRAEGARFVVVRRVNSQSSTTAEFMRSECVEIISTIRRAFL